MEADELNLLFEVFEDAPRQGPGSIETTRHALRLLPDSLRVERVLDLGCGTGGSTIVLAQHTGAHVTAVDIHPPFLAALRARAGELGLADSITTVAADMADVTSLGTGFDLVWAEGSAYSIGFENALRSWRPLLRSGGCLVVTELVWFVAEPAERARAFFADEYLDMRDEATRIDQARDVGYELVGSFRLPAEDWRAYYAGLEAPLREAISRRGDREIYTTLQLEREIYETCGDDYGYLCAWPCRSWQNQRADPRPPDKPMQQTGLRPAADRQDVGRHDGSPAAHSGRSHNSPFAPADHITLAVQALSNQFRGNPMQDQAVSMAVRKIARITGKSGQSEQLRLALARLESATRHEPGCVEFTFFQAISDPDSFVLLEHFIDQSALDAHMQLEHTRAFFSAQLLDSVTAVDVPRLS